MSLRSTRIFPFTFFAFLGFWMSFAFYFTDHFHEWRVRTPVAGQSRLPMRSTLQTRRPASSSRSDYVVGAHVHFSFPRRARWLPDTPHLLFYGSRLLVEIIHIVVLRISSVLLVSSSRSYISSSQVVWNQCMLYAIVERMGIAIDICEVRRV